jgi:hypothetical protein
MLKVISITIDDELLLEIIKPNKLGEVEGGLIIKIVGTKNIEYFLEESFLCLKKYEFTIGTGVHSKFEEVIVCPDIVVTIPAEKSQIAIELENDVQWDFGSSLRQIKKYQERFRDTRIIIPDEYKRFAPLYKNEEFRVYLWKAKRIWQCLRCGTETLKEGPVAPKCSNSKCDNKNQSEFRLIGLKDTTIEEFT